jgi:translation initiation factor 5A
MSEMKQVHAKDIKVGNYLMIDDFPCKATSIKRSAPGKHGHLKLVIEGVGLIDSKKRVMLCSGDARVQAPMVDRRICQILSINDDMAQVMDLSSFETFDVNIPDELKNNLTEGCEVKYWDLVGTKILKELN